MPAFGGIFGQSKSADPAGGLADAMNPRAPAQPWFAWPASHTQPMADRAGGSIPSMRGSFLMSDKHPWADLPTYQEVYNPVSALMTPPQAPTTSSAPVAPAGAPVTGGSGNIGNAAQRRNVSNPGIFMGGKRPKRG